MNILFIDDEPQEVYVDELTLAGHNVAFRQYVEEGMAHFDAHAEELDVLIVDIMMPPRSMFEGVNTDLGLRTGIRFLERIREKSDIPVVLLTHVARSRIARDLEANPRCKYLNKEDTLPGELSDLITRFIQRGL